MTTHSTFVKIEHSRLVSSLNLKFILYVFSSSEHLYLYNVSFIVVGNLPENLDLVDFGSIGFCHIDLNNPRVELQCLEKLWPKIELGGIILIDDYAHLGYDTTYKTFNEFAIKKDITILTTAFGQGIIVKSS